MRRALTFLIVGLLASQAAALTVEDAIIRVVQPEILSLRKTGAEAWESAGNGGYIFRFYLDADGDGLDELFIKSSLRHEGHWMLFKKNGEESWMQITADNQNTDHVHLGIDGFVIEEIGKKSMLITTKRSRLAGLPSKAVFYELHDGKFSSAVTEAGTEELDWGRFNALEKRQRENSKPDVEAVLLWDWISSPNESEWRPIQYEDTSRPPKYGYYQIQGDADRIGNIENFSVEDAYSRLRERHMNPASSRSIDSKINSRPFVEGGEDKELEVHVGLFKGRWLVIGVIALGGLLLYFWRRSKRSLEH